MVGLVAFLVVVALLLLNNISTSSYSTHYSDTRLKTGGELPHVNDYIECYATPIKGK